MSLEKIKTKAYKNYPPVDQMYNIRNVSLIQYKEAEGSLDIRHHLSSILINCQ